MRDLWYALQGAYSGTVPIPGPPGVSGVFDEVVRNQAWLERFLNGFTQQLLMYPLAAVQLRAFWDVDILQCAANATRDVVEILLTWDECVGMYGEDACADFNYDRADGRPVENPWPRVPMLAYGAQRAWAGQVPIVLSCPSTQITCPQDQDPVWACECNCPGAGMPVDPDVDECPAREAHGYGTDEQNARNACRANASRDLPDGCYLGECLHQCNQIS
jgi:hypothetical protein